MYINSRFSVVSLLLISGVLLLALIPGGIVETRDFSHISPTILISFNIFLTALGLGSFGLAYHLKRGGQVNYLPALIGLGYLLVYLLDIFGIFPKTDSPMSIALWSIEVAGCIVALPLTLLSIKLTSEDETSRQHQPIPVWLWFMITIVAVLIIWFASRAAMGS